MRITPAPSLLPEEKTAFTMPNFNRISLSIPKLRLVRTAVQGRHQPSEDFERLLRA